MPYPLVRGEPLRSADARREGDGLAQDPEALARAMEACRRYLLGVAHREISPVLRTKGGASDIVQQTYLEAHRDRDQFSGRSERELKNWLTRILRHNLSNFIRGYRKSLMRDLGREVALDRDDSGGQTWDGLAASATSVSGRAILAEQAERLELALTRLPERDRQVLRWRSHDGCGWEMIGQRLGGSPDMARKVWDRAVDRLRAEVGDATGSSMRGPV